MFEAPLSVAFPVPDMLIELPPEMLPLNVTELVPCTLIEPLPEMPPIATPEAVTKLSDPLFVTAPVSDPAFVPSPICRVAPFAIVVPPLKFVPRSV